MADSKITDLADGGVIQATDEFAVARAGANRKIAGSNVPGFEFDYVEKTANQTATTSEVDYIVGNAVTYDGSTRIKIEVFVPAIDNGTGGTGAILLLYDGATVLGRIADSRGAGSGTVGGGEIVVKAERFLTPSAGSHTYKIRVIKGGTGTTVVLNAGTGGSSSAYLPAWYRITKA